MNWAHNEIMLDWVELIENVLWKWILTIVKGLDYIVFIDSQNEKGFFFFLENKLMM